MILHLYVTSRTKGKTKLNKTSNKESLMRVNTHTNSTITNTYHVRDIFQHYNLNNNIIDKLHSKAKRVKVVVFSNGSFRNFFLGILSIFSPCAEFNSNFLFLLKLRLQQILQRRLTRINHLALEGERIIFET